MSEPLTIERIERLDLNPGDQVALTVSVPTDPQGVADLAEQWAIKFPDNPCVILANGVAISHVIPADVLA